MSHLPACKEAAVVGQGKDKEYKDMIDMFDAGHGKYREQEEGKPTDTAKPVPVTPSFVIKTK
jgi:hypothetical protein